MTIQRNGFLIVLDGGIRIEELYRHPEQYEGKKVTVRGEVVKFSDNILQTNWVHLQDGTSFSGKYDLTVTTPDIVKTGDVVTFEGTLARQRDFGSGYYFEILVEDARRVGK